jgi:hypothetical protein
MIPWACRVGDGLIWAAKVDCLPMTIRQYLARRFVKITLLVLTLDVVTFLLATYVPELNAIGSALGVMVVLSIPAYVIMMARTRCPRCSHSVGMVAWWVGMNRESGFLGKGHCPHCRVSVDEPMDASRVLKNHTSPRG